MFGDIGVPELLVILLLVLILFGPSKLPDIGKSLGEGLRGFKKTMNETDEKSPDENGKKREI